MSTHTRCRALTMSTHTCTHTRCRATYYEYTYQVPLYSLCMSTLTRCLRMSLYGTCMNEYTYQVPRYLLT
jgi:hypothetical protein